MNGILLYWIVPIQILVDTLSCAPDPSAKDQHDPRIDECSNVQHRTIHILSIISDTPTMFTNKHDQQPTTIGYKKLKPYFGWVNTDTIKKTFENTTKWNVIIANRFPMRKYFKSRFPAFNIPRRKEAVATDTISLIHLP